MCNELMRQPIYVPTQAVKYSLNTLHSTVQRVPLVTITVFGIRLVIQ